MIKISDLTDKDVGRYVTYIPSHGKQELGRIKAWNERFIFVVYSCGDNWINFREYTAASTRPEDLHFAPRLS